MTELHDICIKLDELLGGVAHDGLDKQPDSRAVGAYAERAVLDRWEDICNALGVSPFPHPGRRTIFDASFQVDGSMIGVDVRTKDLDEKRYADGGICSVGNLLRLLTRDLGVLIVAEFGYRETGERIKFEYARSAPIHCLPFDAFRIENLGTGQVRLDRSIGESEIEWQRTAEDFIADFCALAKTHYERVARRAEERAEAIAEFRRTGTLRLT